MSKRIIITLVNGNYYTRDERKDSCSICEYSNSIVIRYNNRNMKEVYPMTNILYYELMEKENEDE